MAKLTELGMRKLQPTDAGKSLSDGDSLFGSVAATKKGVSIYFFYRYRRDGKPHNLSCGSWPKKSLKEIRNERNRLKVAHNEDTDPADARRHARIETRLQQKETLAKQEEKLVRPTVTALYEQWAKNVLSKHKDSGEEIKRGLEKDVISAIGNHYAAEIKRADIMAILDSVVARDANRLANRLLAEVRQMFEYALTREIVAVNPTHGIRKRDVGGATVERDRYLSENEITLLASKISGANLIPSTHHSIWVMLATACRIGELTGTQLASVRLDTNVWRIHDSKNGKPHTVYLSNFAKHHLAKLAELSTSQQWLMPSSRHDNPVCKKSITKQVYDRQRGKEKTNGTKLTDSLTLPGGRWVPHDLRRTAATLMQKLGVNSDVIERCLNHTEQNRMKRIYQRDVPEAEMQDAWRRLGERLEQLTIDH